MKKIKNFINNFSIKYFWYSIIVLIIIRLLIVGLLLIGVFDLNFSFDHFTFNQSPGYGDGGKIFNFAKQLSDFEIEKSVFRMPVGMSVYLLPFIFITGAETAVDIAGYVFFISAFLFYSISIIFVCKIAKILFKNNFFGILTGFIYIFYPFIFYFLDLGPYAVNHGSFVNLMLINNGFLTDAPSAMLLYIVFYYLLKFIGEDNLKTRDYILFGLFWGTACLIRETNVIFIFAVAFVMIRKIRVGEIWKHIKNICIAALAFVVAYTPQFIVNYFSRGSFLNNGGRLGEWRQDYFLFEMGTIAQVGFTPKNYLYFLTVLDKYIPFLPLLLILGIILLVLAFYHMYKNINKKYLYLLILWILPFTALFASAQGSARIIRYWLPIIPQLLILLICGLSMIFQIVKYCRSNNLKNIKSKFI